MEYLAKHNGVTLKDHSNAVAIRAKLIASMLLEGYELKQKFGTGSSYSTEDVINACYTAGLLHDAGKAVPYFQDYIKKQAEAEFSEDGIVDYVEDQTDGMRYHNEFSWAFACTYEDELRKAFGIADRKCWEAVKYAIYWHHAAAPDITEITGRDIFYSENFNIPTIAGFVSDLTGIDFSEKEAIDRNIPEYFAINPAPYEDNTLIMFVRAVLIRADREVSGYVASKDECRDTFGHIACPSFFNNERYAKQMEIVDSASDITNVVAAPAGFGKTMVGLAWALRHNQTIYWVCPRNAVIDSVFRGLVDLKGMLGLNICIQKMYTGIIQGTDGELTDTIPHIIVTNIDAITTPLASNRQAIVQHDMLTKPMVFDEFHEFSMDDCPMFAAYNLLMAVRNDFTRAQSLLVSATPITLYNESSWRNPVNYLPKKNGHYDPQHDVPYSVRIADCMDVLGNDHAQVFNVVTDAQEVAMNTEGAMCFHSKYTAEDKEANMTCIYKMYGKGAEGEKCGVASAPIIRASMDISFRRLDLMVSSPNSDMQTIGRCNRWGEGTDATITFVVPAKLSQSNKVYLDHNDIEKDHTIYHKWVECIKANLADRMTLSGLYSVLDKFNSDNADLLSRYQKELHNKGLGLFVKQCYPRRPGFTAKSIKNRGNYGSLRNTDPSISFVVKDESGVYVGPFQIGESYADFANHHVKQAFTPYYRKDRTELMTHIKSDVTFSEHFGTLYMYLTGKDGKAGQRKVEFYGTNPAMWRNPEFPFVVRPSDMKYDKVLGLQEIKD